MQVGLLVYVRVEVVDDYTLKNRTRFVDAVRFGMRSPGVTLRMVT